MKENAKREKQRLQARHHWDKMTKTTLSKQRKIEGERPLNEFPEGRICLGCKKTPLNIYNPGPFCNMCNKLILENLHEP